MENEKSLFKNKKFIIGLIVALVVIAVALAVFFVMRKDDKETKSLKEATYTMYVKINPLVKLMFKETYYECTDKDGKPYICSERSNEVFNYDMLNNDAKEIYDKIDFKGKTVADSLVVLCDVARDNNIGFEALEITSDYEFDREKIAEEIKNKSKYETVYNVFVDFKEHINEQEIIDDAEEGPLVTYTVKFDANGGSAVDDVVVRENDSVLEPVVPTRKGYEFVSWQLNGKNYDFANKITEDITLKAKWKKIEDKTTISTEEQTTRTIAFNSFEFKNAKNGLFGAVNDEAISLTLKGPKSFVKDTKANDLVKYISVVIDLNGKDVGEYDLPIKASIDKEGVEVTPSKSTVKVIVRKEATSTFDKINLNDNILVNEYGRGGLCGGNYAFTDNADTVLAKFKFDDNRYEAQYPDLNIQDFESEEAYREAEEKELAKIMQEWEEAKAKLIYNSTKALNASKEVNSILSSAKGLNKFHIKDNPESFIVTFGYLYIYNYDTLGTFGKTFNKYYTDLNAKIDAVFDKYGRVALIDGGCGSGPEDPVLLTEDLCKKYNLNCSRW